MTKVFASFQGCELHLPGNGIDLRCIDEDERVRGLLQSAINFETDVGLLQQITELVKNTTGICS
jgi:hypothetical protein